MWRMRYLFLMIAVVAVAGFSLEAAESHWAIKSITKSKPPKVKAKAWALGDVDRFVLTWLEATGHYN